MNWIKFGLGFAGAALIGGTVSACGGDTTTTAQGGESSRSPTSTVDKAALIAEAETAVKNELPDIPIWEGTRFNGEYLSESEVCVDRTYGRGGGLDGKGGNAGYVMVTFPGAETGEPQDGLCANAMPEAGPEPVQVPAELEDEPGLVSRNDLGDEWPLTVDYGVLLCENDAAGDIALQIVTFQDPSGKMYAFNGTAKTHTDLPAIDPIWADDPDVDGLKIDMGPLNERGLALC